MGVGAYTTAILVSKYDWARTGRSRSPASSPGLVGFLFGFPALRLSGVYLALATFALAIAFIVARAVLALPGVGRAARRDRVGVAQDAVLPDLGDRARALRRRLALLHGRPAGASGGPRRADRRRLVGDQPRTREGARLRDRRGVRGRRRRPARDPDGARQLPDVPRVLSILLLTGAALGGFGSLGGMIFGALFIQYAPELSADLPTSRRSPRRRSATGSCSWSSSS